MARIENVRIGQSHGRGAWGRLVQQILLIPEAVILLGLLLLAWVFHFPPLISLLAIMTISIFGMRLGLITLAEHHLAQGSYERADRLARTALHLHPWSVDALMLRAQGMVQQGQDEAAIKVLRHAAILSPDDYQFHRTLASTLLTQGETAAGWRLAESVNRTVVPAPAALQQLAWIALHIDSDPAKAIALISRVDPEYLPSHISAPLLITLCDALVAMGRYDEALRLLQRIERQLQASTPTLQAELLYHLGRFYKALGRDGGSYFRRSVQFDPQGRYAQIAWRCAIHSSSQA